jgi:ubiquinone/menaquinone biosynthesis C-methylase UbiE
MRERINLPRSCDQTDPNSEARLQYVSPLAVLARIRLYAYSPSYQSFFKSMPENPDLKGHITDVHYREVEAIKKAGIEKDATIVSLACGDGSDALLWTEKYHHTGRIIGVNLDPIYEYGMYLADKRGYGPVDLDLLHLPIEQTRNNNAIKGIVPDNEARISFLQRDAANTQLPDDCADAVTINNLFHHVDQQTVEAVIKETIRIAKPNAIVAISGRGIKNMQKQWGFIPALARQLEVQRYPQSFYNRFGLEDLNQIMEAYFTPLTDLDYKQEEEMRIPADRIDDYLMPLYALGSSLEYDPPRPPDSSFTHPRLHPSPTEIRRAIASVVMPELSSEVWRTSLFTGGQGYISDQVHQFFKIGINNKYKTSTLAT